MLAPLSINVGADGIHLLGQLLKCPPGRGYRGRFSGKRVPVTLLPLFSASLVSAFGIPLRLIKGGRGWLRVDQAGFGLRIRLTWPPLVLTSRSSKCAEAVDGERGYSLCSRRLRHRQDLLQCALRGRGPTPPRQSWRDTYEHEDENTGNGSCWSGGFRCRWRSHGAVPGEPFSAVDSAVAAARRCRKRYWRIRFHDLPLACSAESE